jgi:hypothetical protein
VLARDGEPVEQIVPVELLARGRVDQQEQPVDVEQVDALLGDLEPEALARQLVDLGRRLVAELAQELAARVLRAEGVVALRRAARVDDQRRLLRGLGCALRNAAMPGSAKAGAWSVKRVMRGVSGRTSATVATPVWSGKGRVIAAPGRSAGARFRGRG